MKGEVLVRVSFFGVNPSDCLNSQGYFVKKTTLPRIIGREFSGMIVKGPTVLMGKKVKGSGGDIGFNKDGSFAEYLAILEAHKLSSLGVKQIRPFSQALDVIEQMLRKEIRKPIFQMDP